jgi:hypothetical protein
VEYSLRFNQVLSGLCKKGAGLPSELGADYGCFDIMLSDDGAAYAVDFNSTPWAGDNRPSVKVLKFMRFGLLKLMNP